MQGNLSHETRLQISVTKLKSNCIKYRLKIKEQSNLLKQKDKEIANLKNKIEDKESQRKELLSYLYKPKNKNNESKPRGKKHGSPAYHRPKPKENEITAKHTYSIHTCPICSKDVGDAVDTVIKYEEDIVLKPKPSVTEHTITRHWCSHCETYVKSSHIPPIHRIGIKTMAYILYARYKLRMPMKKMQESLRDLYNFKISEGEIVEKLKDAKDLFGKDYDAITVLIQNAKAVYSDETGWRMDGENWWLWAFITTTGVKYTIEDTRGKGVAEKSLGEKKDRVIVSDGYAAYQNLAGDKQQCWVHLLRVAKLHSFKLYEDLVLLYKKLLIELEKPLIQRDRKRFEKEFDILIDKDYPKEEVTKVKNRMTKHKPFLFTCLSYEGVLPENNTAERAIRPQVVMRKIFGGSRSLDGAKTHEVNTSVIETLCKQNPDASFFDIMLPLLEKRYSEL